MQISQVIIIIIIIIIIMESYTRYRNIYIRNYKIKKKKQLHALHKLDTAISISLEQKMSNGMCNTQGRPSPKSHDATFPFPSFPFSLPSFLPSPLSRLCPFLPLEVGPLKSS